MSEFDYGQEIVALIKETLGLGEGVTVDQFSAQGTIPEWDSFGHMSIMVAIEEKYKVEVPMGAVAKISSVGEIVNFIKSVHKGN